MIKLLHNTTLWVWKIIGITLILALTLVALKELGGTDRYNSFIFVFLIATASLLFAGLILTIVGTLREKDLHRKQNDMLNEINEFLKTKFEEEERFTTLEFLAGTLFLLDENLKRSIMKDSKEICGEKEKGEYQLREIVSVMKVLCKNNVFTGRAMLIYAKLAKLFEY